MRRVVATLLGVGLLAGTPGALAEHVGRPTQPVCRTSAHFVLHCDPGLTDAYLDAGIASFEEAYSRDVAGGGGEPNAGLQAPVNDGDGRTDVYLMTPPGRPGFSGGIVYRDPNHVAGRGQAAYIFLTPDLSATALRFRAAHEYMHVLLRGYFGMYGPKYEEGFANWAAENALPDVDPGDNNFRTPWLPFDCTDEQCGMGYWQWLFFERQTEDFGVGFMAALLDRAHAAPSFGGDFMITALRDELASRTGRPAQEALRVRFADYARKVWDPAAWRTTALTTIYGQSGRPKADADLDLSAGYPDTGPRTATVNHLAARYARLHFTQTAPDDDLQVLLTPPPGLLAAPDVLVGPETGPRDDVPLTADGAGGYSATIAGPLSAKTAIVPLVNDTEATDELPFTWRARLIGARVARSVPRQRLRLVLRRGLTVKVSLSKPAVVDLRAVVSGEVARRYKLGRRQTRITAVLRKSLAAGTTQLRLPVTATARKRLAKAKRLPLTVLGKAAFQRGTREDISWVGTLRR